MQRHPGNQRPGESSIELKKLLRHLAASSLTPKSDLDLASFAFDELSFRNEATLPDDINISCNVDGRCFAYVALPPPPQMDFHPFISEEEAPRSTFPSP